MKSRILNFIKLFFLTVLLSAQSAFASTATTPKACFQVLLPARIGSFECKYLQYFFEDVKGTNDAREIARSAGKNGFPWQRYAVKAKKVLMLIDNAPSIEAIVQQVGNDKLKRYSNDKRKYPGYFGLKIDQQWRLVFRWENGPVDVDIVDFHNEN